MVETVVQLRLSARAVAGVASVAEAVVRGARESTRRLVAVSSDAAAAAAVSTGSEARLGAARKAAEADAFAAMLELLDLAAILACTAHVDEYGAVCRTIAGLRLAIYRGGQGD